MPESLQQLLQAHFGIKSSWNQNPKVTQVETSITQIVSYNPNRLGLLLTNLGANTVWVAPDNSVSTTKGVRLVPAGGTLTLKWDTDFELVASEWYGIASGAASEFYALEVVSI